MLKKWLIGIPATLLVLFLLAIWQFYFSARPPLMTDPATLAGDGSTINYCELPESAMENAHSRNRACCLWEFARLFFHCRRALATHNN